MASEELIAGLDMGSSRVTCLIGAVDLGGTRVLGGASLPCRGLCGGSVIDITETKSVIERALGEAEAAAGGVTVSGVTLGVRGTRLQSCNGKGAINIARADREITPEDVQNVLANASAIPLSPDCEILHVLPQSFTLDHQRGVPNPIGMEGTTLEADVHIVTASSSHLNNLGKAVSDAGFEVLDTVYSLLATGPLLVTPEERDLGALLVDLGGQSVSLGVYSRGTLRYSKEIGIGSDFITRDLAAGLRASFATAEELKIAHGVASSRRGGDKEIEYRRLDGRAIAKARLSTMMGYVAPRVEEILDLIAGDLRDSSCADLVGVGGLILTGGGSLMKGLPAAARTALRLETRIGMADPERVAGDEKWFSPVYATAMGLLTFSSAPQGLPGMPRLAQRKTPVWLRRLLSLVKGLL